MMQHNPVRDEAKKADNINLKIKEYLKKIIQQIMH
jgi:hypothetical protein